MPQFISIEGLVGEHRIAIDILQQRGRLRDVMCLSLGQDESRKVAQALDQRMDLGAQSAALASIKNLLGLKPTTPAAAVVVAVQVAATPAAVEAVAASPAVAAAVAAAPPVAAATR